MLEQHDKRHQNMIEQIVNSDSEWEQTVDQLINELTQLKDDKERKEHELGQKLMTTSQQLEKLKTDHYRIQQKSAEDAEKLKTEISNSLNSHYLKNILTSYFTTNDTTVQGNLLKVVFQVMKFTDDEQTQIMEIWQDNNKSVMQRVWDFGAWELI